MSEGRNDEESKETAVDGGEDRIGALEMQNLSVGDNRSFLLHHMDSLRSLGAARSSGPNLGALLGEAESTGGKKE